MNRFAALSPYLIPASMPGKKVNVGDGFILKAIERQIGDFAPESVFTNREAPAPAVKSLLERSGTVILAGANQLDDNFAVWPGLAADDLRKMPVRFVPFGIGFNGEAKRNRGFSPNTLATLTAIHEKVEYSSWRCPITVRAIEAALPELKGRALMTGCPVLYDAPLLENEAFSSRDDTIAVTVTERDDFWHRESGTLKYVAGRFPRARRFLVLHQIFDTPGRFETRFGTVPGASLFVKKRARLRILARKLGFEIIHPETARKALDFYAKVDMHIGSRLHAHLHFLSQNKRSFLTYVDDRMKGFSEFLKFPLCTPETFEKNVDFDFEIVRREARQAYRTMRQFLESLQRIPA